MRHVGVILRRGCGECRMQSETLAELSLNPTSFFYARVYTVTVTLRFRHPIGDHTSLVPHVFYNTTSLSWIPAS
jgi:hypothetical protein